MMLRVDLLIILGIAGVKTTNDFIARTGVPEEDALTALKDLRSKHIVSMPPSLLTSWIGVTNYGWRVMGWK